MQNRKSPLSNFLFVPYSFPLLKKRDKRGINFHGHFAPLKGRGGRERRDPCHPFFLSFPSALPQYTLSYTVLRTHPYTRGGGGSGKSGFIRSPHIVWETAESRTTQREWDCTVVVVEVEVVEKRSFSLSPPRPQGESEWRERHTRVRRVPSSVNRAVPRPTVPLEHLLHSSSPRRRKGAVLIKLSYPPPTLAGIQLRRRVRTKLAARGGGFQSVSARLLTQTADYRN